MKVFVWKRKDDNKIATVRTMSESDFITLHETKEKVLQLIEKYIIFQYKKNKGKEKKWN